MAPKDNIATEVSHFKRLLYDINDSFRAVPVVLAEDEQNAVGRVRLGGYRRFLEIANSLDVYETVTRVSTQS